MPLEPVVTLAPVPLIVTETPLSGLPLLSVTVPVMRTCVAGANEVSSTSVRIDNSVFMMLCFCVSEIRMHGPEKFHKHLPEN